MVRIIQIIVIGIIAAMVTVSAYFYTEKFQADPLCQQAAVQQGWQYTQLQPPDLMISGKNRSASNVTRDTVCVFVDAQGGKQYKSISTLAGSNLKDLLISLGLQMDLVFIGSAVILGLLASGVTKLFSSR